MQGLQAGRHRAYCVFTPPGVCGLKAFVLPVGLGLGAPEQEQGWQFSISISVLCIDVWGHTRLVCLSALTP